MNTGFTTRTQLIKLASRLDIPLKWVGFKDKLPKRLLPGFGYIVNLESSTEGHGTHWVCFYVSKYGRQAAYFDAFGSVMPNEVTDTLKNYKVYINRKIVQNPMSGYCGQYCLMFMRFMATHENRLNFSYLVPAFAKLWSSRQRENLGLLRESVAQALNEVQPPSF